MTSKNTLDQSAQCPCEFGTSYRGSYCPVLHIAMTWPCQNLNFTCESERFMNPESSSATTSVTFGAQVCAH